MKWLYDYSKKFLYFMSVMRNYVIFKKVNITTNFIKISLCRISVDCSLKFFFIESSFMIQMFIKARSPKRNYSNFFLMYVSRMKKYCWHYFCSKTNSYPVMIYIYMTSNWVECVLQQKHLLISFFFIKKYRNWGGHLFLIHLLTFIKCNIGIEGEHPAIRQTPTQWWHTKTSDWVESIVFQNAKIMLPPQRMEVISSVKESN